MENLSPEESAPKTGDLLERTFSTRQGPVDFIAEVVVEGSTLILNDIVVYSRKRSPPKGLAREAFAARTQIIAEAKAWGFSILQLTGQRVLGSSSGNPEHLVHVVVDLTR